MRMPVPKLLISAWVRPKPLSDKGFGVLFPKSPPVCSRMDGNRRKPLWYWLSAILIGPVPMFPRKLSNGRGARGGGATKADSTLARLGERNGRLAAMLLPGGTMRRTFGDCCRQGKGWVGGKRGTLRLGQRRGGSHPRVFPTVGAPKGGHIHTGIAGAWWCWEVWKFWWEARNKGVIVVESGSGNPCCLPAGAVPAESVSSRRQRPCQRR